VPVELGELLGRGPKMFGSRGRRLDRVSSDS
jgi:hypothetical protein